MFCPKCGSGFNEKAINFCPVCGEAVSQQGDMQVGQTSYPMRSQSGAAFNTLYITFALLAVDILLIFTMFFQLYNVTATTNQNYSTNGEITSSFSVFQLLKSSSSAKEYYQEKADKEPDKSVWSRTYAKYSNIVENCNRIIGDAVVIFIMIIISAFFIIRAVRIVVKQPSAADKNTKILNYLRASTIMSMAQMLIMMLITTRNLSYFTGENKEISFSAWFYILIIISIAAICVETIMINNLKQHNS